MGETERDAEFSAFVRARQRSLARLGYLLTGDPQSAEDLVQSALMKVYVRWRRLDDIESPEAYVRRVMVNEHISRWRRFRLRREVPDSDLIVRMDPAGRADQPVDDELWAHVRSLAPQQRAAVVLRYYEDLSEAETARVLGCSVGTVKSHTSRAISSLRAKMTEVPA